MSKKYKIQQISDILDIPEKSIDDFLIDLKKFYETNHIFVTLGKVVEPHMKPSKMLKGSSMIWEDDGKHDLKSIRINQKPKLREMNRR